jgi:hypothetical protein
MSFIRTLSFVLLAVSPALYATPLSHMYANGKVSDPDLNKGSPSPVHGARDILPNIGSIGVRPKSSYFLYSRSE